MKTELQDRMSKELAFWMLHQNFTWDWWACFTTDDDHEWRADKLSRGFERYVSRCHKKWAYVYVIDSCLEVNHEWKLIAGQKVFCLQFIPSTI